MSDETMTVGHITITPKGDRIDASCSKCNQGVDIPPRFGMIPGETLLAEWIKQHTHKSRARKATR